MQCSMRGIHDAVELSTLETQPNVESSTDGVGDRASGVEWVSTGRPRLGSPHHLAGDPGAASDVRLPQMLADADHAKGAAEADIVHRRIVAAATSPSMRHHFALARETVRIGGVAIIDALIIDVPTMFQRMIPGVDSCPR